MTIKPCFPAKLKEFKAEYQGYSCSWKQDDEKICLTVIVPENSAAELIIPDHERTILKEGSHAFKIIK